MSWPTDHGANIANEIQGEDAYGGSGPLTDADVWLILDNIHTSMMDSRAPSDAIFYILERTLLKLEALDGELPV